MELKDYQQQTLDTFNRYLEALKEARRQADEFSTLNIDELPPIVREQSAALARAATDYPLAAWESLREASGLPGVTDAQGQNLIPEHISRESATGEPIPHVFEQVFEAEFNKLETDFALYIDKQSAIQWWHRIAARQGYFLQGWRRDRVYPDFIACLQRSQTGQQRLCIFETKGQHLEGNTDTTYKQKLIKTLEKIYLNDTQHGTMDITTPNNKTMSFRMLFEDSWHETVNETIVDTY